MMDSPHLFDQLAPQRKEPLASRLRPESIDDIVGQKHILGEGRLLRRAILTDQLSSLIFYGPPGTGKTTLARVIANHTKAHFMSINAVLAGIAQIREAIKEAQQTYRVTQKKSILFVDEVHRFSKNQQDGLLPHVENGTIILIGATTENPYFEVNKALVSRSRIFELKPLESQDLENIIDLALKSPKAYAKHKITMNRDARSHLLQTCNGDARTLLNAIELAVEPEIMETQPENERGEILIDISIAEESIQKRAVLYDRDGDAHYDIISAFIKSMRGSDPDAALYWMAKMVHAGEDPKFIFRRMIIAASEDVGLADPNVLNQVMAAAQAFDYVGMPEGQFHLTQACLIISNAPKSNSTLGYFDALRSVKKAEASKDDVPQHLKDGNRDGADLGHGKGYKYPHAFENHWVAQQYLPEGMRGKVFYHPSREGHEKQVQLQTEARREATWASFSESSAHHSAYASEESSPGDWEQRGIDSQAENMLLIKKLNMELANLGRDDLVLDYHSQSGYLSFEACRISSGAGVHSIAWKLDQYEQLQHLCKDRDVFQRPQIHDAHHHNIGEDLPSLKQLRFDVIFLRQCMDEVLPQTLFKNLKEHLAEGGRIITCHYLLHKEQRLWNGLSQGSFHSSDDDLYKELEEEYYDSEHFKSHLRDHMFLESFEGIRRDHILEKKITFKRKFHPNVIEKWFDVSSPFGAFLERNAGKKTRLDMANQALQNLQFRTVDWTRHLHLGRYLKD